MMKAGREPLLLEATPNRSQVVINTRDYRPCPQYGAVRVGGPRIDLIIGHFLVYD